MKRRMHAALLSVLALILGTGALVLTTAGTASADLTATVTLDPSGGTVTDVPAFPVISVSAPCPAPYQDALAVYLTINGSDVLLANNLKDGAPFSGDTITTHLPATAGPFNKSIATTFSAAHQTVADGSYPVHIVCKSSDTANTDKPTFATVIEITGTGWAVKEVAPPAATAVTLTATPAGHAPVSQDVTLTATVSPSGAAGTVTFAAQGAPIPEGTDIPVANGVATVTLPGVSTAGAIPLTATFSPADPLAFGTGSGSLSYAFVDEAQLTVLDDEGNALEDTPTLTKGQKIKVSAEGFLPGAGGGNGEDVTFTLDDGTTAAPNVTSDATGKVANYEVTLPDDIADGSHSLVLTGVTSGIKQTFAFRTGAGGTPTDDPTDTPTDEPTDQPTDNPTDTPTDTGADIGGSSDGGSSDGGLSADSSGGTSGGTSGGSSGPLAATGAGGVIPLSVLALLFVTGGGYAAYRVRRDGKLLGFGPTPRD